MKYLLPFLLVGMVVLVGCSEEPTKVTKSDNVFPPNIAELKEAMLQKLSQSSKSGSNSRTLNKVTVAAVPPSWESAYGTAMSFSDDDAQYHYLGFDFEFYGTLYNYTYINSNGNLTFESPNSWGIFALPNSFFDYGCWCSKYFPTVAVMYEDLNPAWYGGGTLYKSTTGTAPDRVFVVTWEGVPRFYNDGTNTIQVQFLERTNQVQFGYYELVPPTWGYYSAVVGLSSNTGNFLQIADYSNVLDLVGKNVCFTPSDDGYTVEDGPCVDPNSPPSLYLSPEVFNIWPVNHKMVLAVTGTASDAEEPAEDLVLNVTVTSSEDTDGNGDGNTAPDWNVVYNGDGTFEVWLRAERSGNGDGRTYTISAMATDSGGLSSDEATGSVDVSKSKGK